VRILIVEDDLRISQALVEDLRRQNHAVDAVDDGQMAYDLARSSVHDVILADILLPSLNGLELCRRLRAEKSPAFILMISARDDVRYKVEALDSGADDYLVKPFDLAELSARIRAVSRRRGGKPDPILEHGELRLDPSMRVVTYGGSALVFTGSEYAIVETLMRNPRQVFSRDMLREKIASYDGFGDSDSVKTHITNIRRKVRAAGMMYDVIENIYGVGYRLFAPRGS
jgi:two-component system, OmpR family, response regulator QseB